MEKREQKKILKPEEAVLVKGMFEHYPDYNNQQILSFFSCPGYDINPRVITQIKRGELHASVQAASKDEVAAFIQSKYKPEMKSSITLFIEQLHITKDEFIEECETTSIEYKRDFSADFNSLIKPILGFSNSEGGYILYGVEDNRKICGMSLTKTNNFNNFDLKNLNQKIASFASSAIKVEKEIKKIKDKNIGILHILPADRKPVICISTGESMSVGRIYYRYNAETTEIRPTELEKIIDERAEIKIKDNFMKMMASVLKNGLSNSLIINSQTGELSQMDGKNLVLPEELLSKINIVKEGHFIEKLGAPAYTLKGEISATVSTIQKVNVPTDYSKTHPYTMTGFSKKLSDFFKEKGKIKTKISNVQIKNVLYEINIYKNDEYHHESPHGAATNHNLNEAALNLVIDYLDKKENLKEYLKTISQLRRELLSK